MRRVPIFLTLAGALLYAAPQVSAAPAHQTVAGAMMSAAQGQLPTSVFPSDFKKNFNQAITAQEADQSTLQSQLHSVSYTNLGMLGGWYQEYVKTLPSGGPLFLTDLVSYYSSPDAATAAFDDSAGGWSQYSTSTCSQAAQCVQLTAVNAIVLSDNQNYTIVFRMLVQSNSIFEGGYVVRQSDLAAQQSSANADLDAMTQAYLNLFNQAPAPTPSPQPTPKTGRTPRPTPSPQPTPVPTGAPTPVNYQLPSSYWPKGTTVTKSFVPTNNDQFIESFHTTSVASLGRIDGQGYEEIAVDRITAKQKTRCGSKACTKKVHFNMSFGYAVSVYGSSSQAASAFKDAKGAIGAPDISSSLGIKVGDQVYIAAVRDSKSKLRAGFLVFQRGKVSVEMAVFTPYKRSKYRDAGIYYLAKQATWLDSQAQTQG